MTSVRTTSDTPGFETGQMVQFQDFVLTNTTVSFFLTTLEGSGGIISVWRTIVDQSSTIRVEVAANITVASSFQSDIVDMYLVIISGRSSVEIILPKAIQRATGSAQYAALSIDTVSVIGSSALRIGSNFSVACKWPNNIMWLLSAVAATNSTIEVFGLLVQTSTSIGIIVSSCGIRDNSLLSLRNIEVSSTATLGVSFMGAASN